MRLSQMKPRVSVPCTLAGLTNDCLVASSHDLAVRYNDRAVLESHHCSTFSWCVPFPTLPIILDSWSSQHSLVLLNEIFKSIWPCPILLMDPKAHISSAGPERPVTKCVASFSLSRVMTLTPTPTVCDGGSM